MSIIRGVAVRCAKPPLTEADDLESAARIEVATTIGKVDSAHETEAVRKAAERKCASMLREAERAERAIKDAELI